MKVGFNLIRVIKLAGPEVLWLIPAALLAVIVGVAAQGVPVMLRSLVNNALAQPGRPLTAQLFLAPALLTLGVELLRIFQRLCAEKGATRLQGRLFGPAMHHLVSHPLDFFGQNHTGALQVRLERSCGAIVELVKTLLADMLSPCVALVTAVILLWHTSERVGAVSVAAVTTLTFVTLWQTMNQNGIRVKLKDAREQQGVNIAEAVSGIESVKIFHAEEIEGKRAGIMALRLGDEEFHHHVVMARFDMVKVLIDRGGFVLTLVLTVFEALQPGSPLGAGGVLMIALLYERVAEPVRHLHRVIDETLERLVLARDFFTILECEAITRIAAITNSPVSSKDIVFDDVSFYYPTTLGKQPKAAIKNVSCCFRAGQKVALIGASGCGKSTLARLLCGFYTPSEGDIYIGETPALTVEENAPYRIGMLSQSTHIFAGSVSDNIRYGRPDASDAEVREAARVAGVAEAIESHPAGYERILGQNGKGLSGGQCQRLSLARVILQRPEIVIFDEPTAALDSDNSRRFFQEVLRIYDGQTIIVITHDTLNLSWADQVIVMDSGAVISDYLMDSKELSIVAGST